MVVMRGFNDDEIPQLAALTYDYPYHVRFIELMPFQDLERWNHNDLYMPVGEIVRKIPHIDKASVGPTLDTGGSARLCTLPGARGKVGFIAPLGWHFCGGCNRLRLTADDKIRTCLFSDDEIDVRHPLRRGASKDELIQIFKYAVEQKPRRHHLSSSQFNHQRRGMYAIGG
jgi:cyclic pyranopterin phosphate synthase